MHSAAKCILLKSPASYKTCIKTEELLQTLRLWFRWLQRHIRKWKSTQNISVCRDKGSDMNPNISYKEEQCGMFRTVAFDQLDLGCLAAVEALENLVLSLYDSYKMLLWFDSICCSYLKGQFQSSIKMTYSVFIAVQFIYFFLKVEASDEDAHKLFSMHVYRSLTELFFLHGQ